MVAMTLALMEAMQGTLVSIASTLILAETLNCIAQTPLSLITTEYPQTPHVQYTVSKSSAAMMAQNLKDAMHSVSMCHVLEIEVAMRRSWSVQQVQRIKNLNVVKCRNCVCTYAFVYVDPFVMISVAVFG